MGTPLKILEPFGLPSAAFLVSGCPTLAHQSIWLERWKRVAAQFGLTGMAGANDMPIKPLASWKTWWCPSNARDIACSLHQTIDPTKLPGDGKVVELKCNSKVCEEDLNDFHTSKVVEGLLNAYPGSKEPSAYLLGDTCVFLNDMMGNCIFGPAKANPVDERARRTKALKEGTYLKMLLSYARASSGRSSKGRSQTVTYLKELALSKGRPERKGKGSRSSDSTCASPASTTSTMSAQTLVMGVDTAPVTPVPGNLVNKFMVFFFFTLLVCCYLDEY